MKAKIHKISLHEESGKEVFSIKPSKENGFPQHFYIYKEPKTEAGYKALINSVANKN